MNRPNSKSLSNRLLKIVSILAMMYLVCLLVIMVTVGFAQADKSHKELEQKLALSLSNTAAIALYVNNKEIADEVISSLLLHEEIDAVRLESDEGVSFSSNHVVDAESSLWVNSNQYRLYSPTDGEPLGTLYIHNNHSVLQQKALSQVFSQVAFALGQFFVTVIALVLVFERIIGKPLTSLSNALNSATPGSTDLIPIDKKNQENELGVVVNSVNTFIENSRHAIERERGLRSQIEHWEQYYRNLAEQDTLTGLKNRLGCEKYVEQVASSSRYIALLLVDLDGFKGINDSYGHAAGDFVLKEIAKRFSTLQLDSNVPGVVGRIGGDEFVIYLALQKTDQELLEDIASDAVRLANLPFAYQSHVFSVGCSVGISVGKTISIDAEKLVHQADQAMYAVKQLNKNDYQFYQAEDNVTNIK
ncbi:GGDEF domain-containing protein [Vibrio hepatarius]|jgi:diguanylate cyclase (GGDEF)-like protein|uniref:Diguanylate cyclase n=1 Tax=Vibrio hepatarius TaxID=171383 RepID=A0A0M0I172_9VIBR|nr:GGDEF domain-containing protein [Vibrio hepatarius]KOO07852.1 diguanylate cyclase [Vibrio hepatarius]NOI14559.1 GGDEF domain-containing protein [Vibrio hepatarius]